MKIGLLLFASVIWIIGMVILFKEFGWIPLIGLSLVLWGQGINNQIDALCKKIKEKRAK